MKRTPHFRGFTLFRGGSAQGGSFQGGDARSFERVTRTPRFYGSAALIPGVLMLMMGVLALIAPRFIVFLAAAFFLYAGAILLLIGWKFITLRKRFMNMTRDIEAHFEIRQSGPTAQFRQEEDTTKIILH